MRLCYRFLIRLRARIRIRIRCCIRFRILIRIRSRIHFRFLIFSYLAFPICISYFFMYFVFPQQRMLWGSNLLR